MKLDDLKLAGDEKIIKAYYPKSILGYDFNVFSKRTSLIITNKKVILRGMFKNFDKEINFDDISDVLSATSFAKHLDILKKGELPYEPSGYYSPYFSCGWLSASDFNEVYNFIKIKIEK